MTGGRFGAKRLTFDLVVTTPVDLSSSEADLTATPAAPPSHRAPAAIAVERQILRAVFGVATVLLIARTKVDADLWGHTRFGGDILRDGFSRADPYSFTSDIEWINHEWLSEVSFWLAWTAGGGLGLILLKMLLVVGTLLLVWRVLRRVTLPPLAEEALFLLVVVGTWPRTSVIRPQLFSLFLFAALLWVIQSVSRERPRPIFWIPLIFWAWINLHGGWIVGFGIFGLWLVFALVSKQRPVPATTLLGVAVASAALLLLNPYGWDMLEFIATTVRIDRSDIRDWQPIWHSGFLLGLWSYTALVAGYILVTRRAQVPLWQWAIVIGLAVASLRVSRLDMFFNLAVAMLLGPHLGTARAPAARRWRPEPLMAGFATAIGVIVGSATGMAVDCVGLDIDWAPERESGAFIKANQLEGRLLAWYDWGQYVIWHFGPKLSVSLDGRRETVYSDRFLKEHYALYDYPEDNLAMLERLNADYAWLPSQMLLVRSLDQHGWTRIFTGEKSVIFARRPGQFVEPPPPEGPACFPGP